MRYAAAVLTAAMMAATLAPVARADRLDLWPAATGTRSGESWYDAGSRAYGDDRYDTAARDYEEAARAGYRPAHAWYNAACAHALAGHDERALDALSQAIESGWDDASKIRSDRDLDGLRSNPRFRQLIAQLEGPRGEETRKRVGRSRYDALEQLHSDDPQAWRSLGMDLMRGGDPAQGARAFAREYEISGAPSSLYNQACAEAIARMIPQSLATLERSILAGYGDRSKLQRDDDLDNLRGQPGFDRLVRLADDLTLELVGLNTLSRWQWQNELPHYEKMVKEHPVGRAWSNLGYAQIRAREPEAATVSLKKALEMKYRVPVTLYNLGCAASLQGNLDESVSWLEKAADAGMDVRSSARSDNDLDAVRKHPRFRALMDRLDEDRWNSRREDRRKS